MTEGKTLVERLAELLFEVAVELEGMSSEPKPTGETAAVVPSNGKPPEIKPVRRKAQQRIGHVRWSFRTKEQKWDVSVSTGLHPNVGQPGVYHNRPWERLVSRQGTEENARQAAEQCNNIITVVLGLAYSSWIHNYEVNAHNGYKWVKVITDREGVSLITNTPNGVRIGLYRNVHDANTDAGFWEALLTLAVEANILKWRRDRDEKKKGS